MSRGHRPEGSGRKLEQARVEVDKEWADLLARQIVAYDELAARRRLLDEELILLDASLEQIEAATYRARIDVVGAEELDRLLTRWQGRLDDASGALGAAIRAASICGPGASVAAVSR